ncbi:hypothetical protein RGUI_0283 [Rhodovulum sp. P5]|nr:hypothetical protein RGUI_0283 [Rhodovulum sp. P5]
MAGKRRDLAADYAQQGPSPETRIGQTAYEMARFDLAAAPWP